MTSRPILAVDVDGVISLFGYDDPPSPTEARYELVDGNIHCISLRAGERLRRLEEHFEMVWATGWEDKANFYLPTMLGLEEYPPLTFGGAAPFGSAPRKRAARDSPARGGALAWVDDNLDDSCYRWARERDEPTLLVPTDPAIGLQEAETEALIAWGSGLAVEAGE